MTETMQTYSCNGCRNVKAESMGQAADIFAGRLARREYGRRAYAAICNLDSQTMCGTMGNYNAFIGTAGGQGTTVGKNIMFSVYLEK